MPLFLWIGTLLGTLFTSLVQFFMTYMTKRLAIVAAVITAISVLTFAFFAAVLLIVSGIITAMPPEVSIAVSFFVPTNAYACFSAFLTAHTVRWVYEWNVKVVQLRLF